MATDNGAGFLRVVRDGEAPGDGSKMLNIIAVHGLDGHHHNSWTHSPPVKSQGRLRNLFRGKVEKAVDDDTSDEIMWLRDLLPEKLPRARIMTFEYEAHVLRNISPFSVRDRARALVLAIRDDREAHPESGDPGRIGHPILFIGHSLGGIVIKQALTLAHKKAREGSTSETKGYEDIAESTKGIVFFGTPHRGADSAKWMTMLSSITATVFHRPPPPLIKALEKDSQHLTEISEDFRTLADKYAIASFYEGHAHSLLGRVIVEKASALMWLPHEEAIPISGDHSTMCKFWRGDRRFEPVWKAIRRTSMGR